MNVHVYVGTKFRRLIPELVTPHPPSVQRHIFCSGKVYYELVKHRDTEGLTGEVAISRIEQVSNQCDHKYILLLANWQKTNKLF